MSGRRCASATAPAEAPLFRIEGEGETKDFLALEEVLGHVRAQATKGIHIQRYKGLGEMNADQLWDTTMNPETRLMKVVTVEDAAHANEVFETIMGADVAPRKKFIQANAQYVTNLDV